MGRSPMRCTCGEVGEDALSQLLTAADKPYTAEQPSTKITFCRCAVSHVMRVHSAGLYTLLPIVQISGGIWQFSEPGEVRRPFQVT